MTSEESVALLSECVGAKTVNPPGDETQLAEGLARRFERDGVDFDPCARARPGESPGTESVVPDRCRVDVDVRTVPGVECDDVVRAIRAACAALDFEVAVAIRMSAPAVETDAALPAVRTAAEVAGGLAGRPDAADAVPYFTEASVHQPSLGLRAIMYGPGEPHLAHQPDEWVSLRAYADAVRFRVECTRAYLG